MPPVSKHAAKSFYSVRPLLVSRYSAQTDGLINNADDGMSSPGQGLLGYCF